MCPERGCGWQCSSCGSFKKVFVYWYEARARCDKEITLIERVRTDLDKKLIALKSRESSSSSSAHSLFPRQNRSHIPSLDWRFQRLLSLPRSNSFSYTFKGRVPALCFVVHCLPVRCRTALLCFWAHSRISVWSAWEMSFGGVGDIFDILLR